MANKRDYYEVLGVSKDVSDDALKKAYRKLAKQYHPDLNPGDEVAEAKFKEAAEAYGVLSDPQKRQQYDQFGHAGMDGQGFSGAGFGIDLDDLFGSFGSFFGGGGRQGRRRNGPRRGADMRYRMKLEFEEAAFGCTRQINYSREDHCPDCQGTGAEAGTKVETCSVCHGQGTVMQQQQSLFGMMMSEQVCQACRGTGKQIQTPCSTCRGQGRKQKERSLEVRIPAGINEGEMLTLRGEGEAGYNGGGPGDLYIEIQVKPHKLFQRKGYHTYCDFPLTFAQMTLGAEVEMPTLDGPVVVTIKEGTQPGDTISLKGRGIPVINREGSRGDQFVTVNLEIPRHLDEAQKEKLRAFDATLSDKNYQRRSSFFSRLKDFFHR